MDGYTTIAYALMAVIIQPVFFPAKTIGLILIFGGFATEALARPIGSIVFGNFFGDRLGRKYMLVVTIIGFSSLAALKGALPSYAQIGIFAPIMLYIVLFFEGMFAGAEYGGGTALSMESIPPEKRSFIGAFVQSGFGMGYFLISFVSLGFSGFLGDAAISTFGWRLIFATTLVPGFIALIIRIGVKETPVFEEMKEKKQVEKIPISALIRSSPKAMIVGLTITTGLLYVNTATFSFYPSVMKLNGISDADTFLSVGIINLLSLIGIWSGGIISGLIGGRRRPMLVYSLLFTATIYPLIILGISESFRDATIFFGIQAIIEAMIFSTIPAFLAESFSKKFRVTAVSFTYNGGAIVGGFALTFIAALELPLGLTNAWIINLFIASVVMFIGVLLSRETWISGKDVIAE